jgi:hypothetical protein
MKMDYTAKCGCKIVQHGKVWHGDGFIPERTEIVNHCSGNWISVKDRLPDENGFYLVATTFHSAKVRYTSYKKDTDYPWAYFQTKEITHWMPLPEPPKESE